MVKSKDTGEDEPKGKGEGRSKASNWVHSKDLKKLQHNGLVASDNMEKLINWTIKF